MLKEIVEFLVGGDCVMGVVCLFLFFVSRVFRRGGLGFFFLVWLVVLVFLFVIYCVFVIFCEIIRDRFI